VSYPLDHGSEVRRGGLEPPCGMPGLQPSAVAAAPPTHEGALRDSDPLCPDSQSGPSATWVKAPVRNEGLEPSRNGVWNRRSAAELIAHEYAQEESNPHREIRNLVPYPLDHGRLVPAGRADRPASRASGGCSAAELSGRGDDDGTRTRTVHLDGVEHWPVVLRHLGSDGRTRTFCLVVNGHPLCQVSYIGSVALLNVRPGQPQAHIANGDE
jgi:hypothetical protein